MKSTRQWGRISWVPKSSLFFLLLFTTYQAFPYLSRYHTNTIYYYTLFHSESLPMISVSLSHTKASLRHLPGKQLASEDSYISDQNFVQVFTVEKLPQSSPFLL
ncbi:Hypothetical predicted protein [Podarcis lilfordi]|uniref:Uncharacterized protein n=1 Tax=Podarcis lilfordi TaxID=74358 RepID=A0AA35L0K5_9SAUR|nr:Hypothetical predicted protein [Podarcis lilfordi]